MQIEQAHRVRDRRATATDFKCDIFLAHSEFSCQTRVTLRLFDRIEIAALQIFDQAKARELPGRWRCE